MSTKQFYLILAVTFVSVFFLSYAWEFYLEDMAESLILKGGGPESPQAKWEYINTVLAFIFIALILPTIVGRRLIIRQRQLHEEITRLSEEDYLTKLYNRRKMCQEIDSEISRCKRYNRDFCIVMLDIDHFKQANDALGHQSGDQLLVEIADIIKKTIRKSDSAGRWGGEEFIILCPETNVDGSSRLAEKLRARIENKGIPEIGRVTASFGVVAYAQGETMHNIIGKADDALYSAKNAGRNKVVVRA